MNKLKKSFHRNSGFTLIELLIVIVIIGILAGVLIAVINPFRQQNRARNASIEGAITKLAFAVNTARAGLGTLPDETQLTTELENITPSGTTCNTTNSLDCIFALSGTVLPMTCSASGEPSTNGTTRCLFRLVSTGLSLISGKFRIIAQRYNLNPDASNTAYVFDSSTGLWSCTSGANFTADDLSAQGCLQPPQEDLPTL